MALTMARPLSGSSSPYADGPIWKYAPRYSDDPTWKSLPKQRPRPSALDNGLGGQSLRSVQSRCPISSWERPLGSVPLTGHVLSRDLDIHDRFVESELDGRFAMHRVMGHSVSPYLDGASLSRGAHPFRSRDDLMLDRRGRADDLMLDRRGRADDLLLDRRGRADDLLLDRRGRADELLLDGRGRAACWEDDALLARSRYLDDPLCMTQSRYLDDRQYFDDPLWTPASTTLHDPLWRRSALDGRLLGRSTSARAFN